MNLSSPLSSVLRTTNEYLKALDAMDIRTVGDLLDYLPRDHEDLSVMEKLRTAEIGVKSTFRGTVESIRKVRTRTGKVLVSAKFTDPEGQTAEVIWFNQPHIVRMLAEGDEVVLVGKLVTNGNRLQIQSPQFERSTKKDLVHAGKLVPVYPQHDIINTKWLREKMALVKSAVDLIPETLDDEVLLEEDLMSKSDAVRTLHFPENGADIEKAKFRMAFENMYELQQDVLNKKREWQGVEDEQIKIPMNAQLIKEFFSSLQFTPTNGQKIAIYEILKDMEKGKPMSRLLEGDVGSGKTLVATAVIANVIQHGGQAALMVPTEVLARQHSQSIAKVLQGFHTYLEKKASENEGESLRIKSPNVVLLTGSLPKSEADEVRRKLHVGTADLVIGTHALIQDKVNFKHLRFVIVDEQHRFGVLQRETLKSKGNPHFLSMTATPIPRTLALTAYGDNDLSVLTEKPGGRKPIATKVVPPRDRKTVELFIDNQINEGRQVFVICPLISESENEDMSEIKNVEQEVRRLKEGFPHRRIAHLHGKMPSADKERIMAEFKNRSADILVSTSVIEVGIDVPNASIIVIEGSERFGLSQLHQFRGRVGRGEHQSHCFLFTTEDKQSRSVRLKAMEDHDDGFVLAEIDLKIRGPGELHGFRQSGVPTAHFSSLMNPDLVVRARRAAEKHIFGSALTPSL